MTIRASQSRRRRPCSLWLTVSLITAAAVICIVLLFPSHRKVVAEDGLRADTTSPPQRTEVPRPVAQQGQSAADVVGLCTSKEGKRLVAKAKSFVDDSCFVISLRRPVPSFEPRELMKDALDHYNTKEKQVQLTAAENSVTVDEADLNRAKSNVVHTLHEIPPLFSVSDVDESSKPRVSISIQDAKHVTRAALSRTLYNALANFFQEKALDAKPIFLDFGCTMGHSFASGHKGASTICLLDDSKSHDADAWFLSSEVQEMMSVDAGSGSSSSSANSSAHRRLGNVLWLNAKGGFLEAPFSQLYTACNFFTMSAVLFPLAEPLELMTVLNAKQRSGTKFSKLKLQMSLRKVLGVLRRLIPSSAVTIAAIPFDPSIELSDTEYCVNLQKALDREELSKSLKKKDNLAEEGFSSEEELEEYKLSSASFSCERIAVVQRLGGLSFSIVRLVLEASERPCRKTWGAPLVQWGRSLKVSFDHGAVRFQVNSVEKAKAGARSAARVIHPLQYRHSVNLDTLLGAGLALPLRNQALGHIIRSPRYSDPLPHNWVLTGGGVIERIDKIDLRYDREVDESKGYWGHSSLGYFHLFGHHLCLKLTPSGMPVAAVADHCRETCVSCVKSCSYLPKGSSPCEHCHRCGQCVEREALSMQLSFKASVDEHTSIRGENCQKTYSSMHGARAIWKQWEKADNKNPL